MITAVGHADLAPDTLRAVERELRVRLERLGEPVSGLVRAGSALSVTFGRVVRASGRRLVVLLPAQRLVRAHAVPGSSRRGTDPPPTGGTPPRTWWRTHEPAA